MRGQSAQRLKALRKKFGLGEFKKSKKARAKSRRKAPRSNSLSFDDSTLGDYLGDVMAGNQDSIDAALGSGWTSRQTSNPNPLNSGNLVQPQYPAYGPANPNPNQTIPPELIATGDIPVRFA
jgi:hypothetical protein